MKKQDTSSGTIKEKAFFGVHVLFLLLAWLGPFLFWWPLIVTAYLLVQFQFYFFNKCLMNETHQLEEENHSTLYSHLFEAWGFKPDRKKLAFFVRRILHIVLALFAILWQVVLGFKPLL